MVFERPNELATLADAQNILEQLSERRVRFDTTKSMIIAAYEGNASLVEEMIAKGAHVDGIMNDSTALQVAAREGHLCVVAVLLSNGADIHCRGSTESPPIYLASSKGHTSIVELLISKGARSPHL